MKICEQHWEKLREAIRARGLWGFVAQSGEALVEKANAEVASGPTAKTFDPLFAANMAIVSNVLGLVGVAAMVQEEDGSERCPICFIQRSHDERCNEPSCTTSGNGFDSWIDRAADDQLAEAKRLGLMGDG